MLIGKSKRVNSKVEMVNGNYQIVNSKLEITVRLIKLLFDIFVINPLVIKREENRINGIYDEKFDKELIGHELDVLSNFET